VRLPQGIVGDNVLGSEVVENLKQFRVGRVGQMKKAPQIVREYMPYGRVLIVDDVESNLYVARGLMAPYGLSIETAVSGFEAVEKIRNGATFDVIFMDHMMPEMDGIKATKIIRDMGYTNPIIALTANALAGQAEVFMQNGFDGFISKPIDLRQLNASLNKLVRDRYPLEVVEAARRLLIDLNIKKSAAAEVQPVSDPELAAIFVRDAEKVLARLELMQEYAYRRTDDFRMFVINVHAMKSALANIGETKLSAAAFKLEQAGRDEDLSVMKAETPEFMEALRKVIEKNRPKDDGELLEEDSEYDRTFLGEKLLAIQKACEEYDEKTASTAVAELKQLKLPRSVRELLDAIDGHLLHSDFEEAANIAKAWKEVD
jgi:CheY-like chemotaxis protein